MRLFKIGIYALLVLVLQTVVFARLNIFGAVPDLILVSVIIFAVLGEMKQAILFAAAAGFLQDVLSHGIYVNMITKVLVGTVVNSFKEGFAGAEFSLALGAVAVLTPLALLGEASVLFLFAGRHVDILGLVASLLLSTLYNLILVPLLFPAIRRLTRA